MPLSILSLQNAVVAIADSLYGALQSLKVFNRKDTEVEYVPLEPAEDETKMHKKMSADTPKEALNWRLFFGVFVFGKQRTTSTRLETNC